MKMKDFTDFLITASRFRELLREKAVLKESAMKNRLIDNMDSIIEDVCIILGLMYADKYEEIRKRSEIEDD